ncbi:thioredoxin-like [Branchiostoma floridae x Branchiostoma japonicum]
MRFSSQFCLGIVCLLVHARYGVWCVRDLEDLDECRRFMAEGKDHLVVVLFTATWCGPCKMIAPQFVELSRKPENADVIFGQTDVDDAADISEEYNINCMPTFVFLKKAKEIDRFSGANLDTLKEKISEYR